MDANMQLTINGFEQLFPDKVFFSDISLTAVKFPHISCFSRQVVTLYTYINTHILTADSP